MTRRSDTVQRLFEDVRRTFVPRTYDKMKTSLLFMFLFLASARRPPGSHVPDVVAIKECRTTRVSADPQGDSAFLKPNFLHIAVKTKQFRQQICDKKQNKKNKTTYEPYFISSAPIK